MKHNSLKVACMLSALMTLSSLQPKDTCGSTPSLVVTTATTPFYECTQTSTTAASLSLVSENTPIGQNIHHDFDLLCTGIAQNNPDKISQVLAWYPSKFPLFALSSSQRCEGRAPLGYAIHCESTAMQTLLDALDIETTMRLINRAMEKLIPEELDVLLQHAISTVSPDICSDAKYWVGLIDKFKKTYYLVTTMRECTYKDDIPPQCAPCLIIIFTHIQKSLSLATRKQIFDQINHYTIHGERLNKYYYIDRVFDVKKQKIYTECILS